MNVLVIGRCLRTCEQFATFCDNVIIVADDSFPTDRVFPELEQFVTYHSDINIRVPYGIPAKTIELIKLIKKYDADVVFSNVKCAMIAAKLASLFIKKKVVLMATGHNSIAWLDSRKVSAMAFIIRHTTDVYVALASFVKDMLLAHGIKENRICLVPNTLYTQSWSVKSSYKAGNRFRMVYVAYVCPDKRQDMIIEALKLLKGKYDVVVDCYGEASEFPEYIEKLQSMVKEYKLEDNFHIHGLVENVYLRGILKDYDAYVSTSRMEMSPVNLLEAEAVGLPVISSRVGGVTDLIEDNYNGILFTSEDVKELVEKISIIIEDEQLRERIGKTGRKVVSEGYTTADAGNRLKKAIIG